MIMLCVRNDLHFIFLYNLWLKDPHRLGGRKYFLLQVKMGEEKKILRLE